MASRIDMLKGFPLDFWPRDGIKLNSTFARAHSTAHPEKRNSSLDGTRDRRKQFRVYASTSSSASRTSHFAVVKCFLAKCCVRVKRFAKIARVTRRVRKPNLWRSLNELRANLLLVWREPGEVNLWQAAWCIPAIRPTRIVYPSADRNRSQQTTNGADCVLNIAAPNPLLTARENLKPSRAILRALYVCTCIRRQKRPSVLDSSLYREKQSKDRNNSRRPVESETVCAVV